MDNCKDAIGHWTEDSHGLPAYKLEAALPLTHGLLHGEPVVPIFLLGNHGLTAFVHGNGAYQLHTGERAWAQLNPVKSRPGGDCTSTVQLNGATHDLLAAPATERLFGCGFARNTHALGDCNVTRELATPPSRTCGDRLPVLFITLKLHNPTGSPIAGVWTESLGVRYDFSFRHNYPYTKDRLDYPVKVEEHPDRLSATFTPTPRDPLILAKRDDPAWQECYPPQVHLAKIAGNTQLHADRIDDCACRLVATTPFEIPPQESLELRIAVGYSAEDQDWPALAGKAATGVAGSFRDDWQRALPDWTDPADPELAQEMRWHFYCLQAMATWSDVYQETFIPQGTVYEYSLGVAAVIRDHLQHAMPLCYADAPLAASILRYTVKHTDPWGAIRHGDEGANQFPLGADQKSDSQIYALYTLAEYLRAGNPDAAALLTTPLHFLASSRATDLLDCGARWVRYLRDTVSVGGHGFVRLLCSDWNDCFYGFFKDLPYSKIFHDGESGLNTAMAIVALGRLADGLEPLTEELGERRPQLVELVQACRDFRQELLDALRQVLGDRDFLVRAMVDGSFDPSNDAFVNDPAQMKNRVVGLDEMFFEPQPHLLAIPELAEHHEKIWQAIRDRVYDDEPCGARQRETPGQRENGGIWFALNGPLVDALVEIDTGAAREALEKLTCRRRRQTYPGRWIGQWSCGDSINSHQFPDAERAGRVASYLHPMPVYCAHAHAWPLHGWLRLNKFGHSSRF